MANFARAFRHFTMAQLLEQQKERRAKGKKIDMEKPKKFDGVLKSFDALAEKLRDDHPAAADTEQTITVEDDPDEKA